MAERSLSLSDSQLQIVKARLQSAREKAEARDKNTDSDALQFPSEGDRNIALVGGHYWPKMNKQAIRFQNHIAPVALIKHRVTTNGRREFVVKPTQQRFAGVIDQASGTLHDAWRSLDLEADCKACYWDVPIHKMGVVEIGWVYEDGQGRQTRGQRPEPAIHESAESVIGPGGEMEPPDPQEYESEEEAAAAAVVSEDIAWGMPLRDDPFVERFDPRDFWVDPQCVRSDLSDASYAFRCKRAKVADIKRNKRYRNTGKLKASSYTGDASDKASFSAQEMSDVVKSDCGTIEIYDGYVKLDLDRDGVDELVHVVLAEGGEKELLCAPFEYEFSGRNPYPFEVILNWRPSNDELTAASDVSQTRWLQIEHDECYTQVSKKRRRAANKLLGPSLEEGDTRRDALHSSEEAEYVGFDDPQEQAAIRWLEHPPQNVDAYNFLEAIPERIRGAWGVNDFQANLQPDRKMLAAEVRQMGNQGGIRQEGDLESYNNFCARVAYKVLMLLQQFTDRQRPYAYRDAGGNETWGTATLEGLRGVNPVTQELEPVGVQFVVEIDAYAAGARNKWSERQEVTDLLRELAPLVNMPDPQRPGLPMIQTRELLRELLQKYDLPNMNEIIPPAPSPDDQIATALQIIQKLSGELQRLKSAPPMIPGMEAAPMLSGAAPGMGQGPIV